MSCLPLPAWSRWAVALGLMVFAPSTARADPSGDDARALVAAEALFQQGRAEMARGDFAPACEHLAESQRLAPAPGTAFNLADCYVHIGRLASAWSLFRDVEGETRLAGQLARAAEAARRAAALEPTLPRIRVDVEARIEGIEVQRDGVAVGRAQWGVEVPVDLGAHTVTARAPGKKLWRKTIAIARAGEIALVTVSALEPEEARAVSTPAAAPPSPAPAVAPVPAAVPPTTAPGADLTPASRAGPSKGAVVLGAIGLGLLAGAGVTAAIGWSIWHEAASCPQNMCPSQMAADDRNRGRSWGNVATGLAIVGGLGVGAGVISWIRDARGTTDGTAPAAGNWVFALGIGSVGLGGAW